MRKQWYRLDNAALMFPAIIRKNWNNVFRVAVTLTEPVILMAEDLAPGETMQLDHSRILGIVTHLGSESSHAAILARTMNLPAITGIAISDAWDGHEAVLDGENGLLMKSSAPYCKPAVSASRSVSSVMSMTGMSRLLAFPFNLRRASKSSRRSMPASNRTRSG